MPLLFRVIMVVWMGFAPTWSMAFSEHFISLAGHNLKVELATEEKDLQQGLMFRKTIAPYDGMLFDFGQETTAQMWMKNTLIPLDMVFFDDNRKIVHLHYGAVPHSLDRISSPLPARYVLELNAGDIDRLGLKLGDRFEYEVKE